MLLGEREREEENYLFGERREEEERSMFGKEIEVEKERQKSLLKERYTRDLGEEDAGTRRQRDSLGFFRRKREEEGRSEAFLREEILGSFERRELERREMLVPFKKRDSSFEIGEIKERQLEVSEAPLRERDGEKNIAPRERGGSGEREMLGSFDRKWRDTKRYVHFESKKRDARILGEREIYMLGSFEKIEIGELERQRDAGFLLRERETVRGEREERKEREIDARILCEREDGRLFESKNREKKKRDARILGERQAVKCSFERERGRGEQREETEDPRPFEREREKRDS
ncbi:hypothetical protein MUG91_G1575n2 [Manis pentadactyla]|nr:hypothetical protein MUG91_G1575n2 [Manis pentadactyla]